MRGTPKDPRHFRLATGRQLWRLNQLGRLRRVDEAQPINSAEAKALIVAEFEKLEETERAGASTGANRA